MVRFRLTVQAEIDFDNIGEYTQVNWGTEQAETYLSELDEAFNRLTERPFLRRKRSEFSFDIWSHKCNHHIIFFRRDDGGNVEVLRILHERMDVDAHL